MKQETERSFPDGGKDFVEGEFEELSPPPDCGGAFRLQDRGNTQYTWWYLINASDRTLTTTIRRSWLYQGQTRSDTQQHTLYPREEREVFSFDRIQNPRVTPLSCTLS